MLGTLNGALEVRGITLPPRAIRADAEGVNEVRDRVPVLTRVDVRYSLTIPPGSREVVERALATHQEKCPTARSLAGAVEVRWTADVREGAA
jgi:organic hydroperoxide reductase OsmC/OhrA